MAKEIKMFIAGEEVVSNNDFTINEEMLSASSTILNNCYPKTWELSKDYTSEFYFPKDYSKFILAEGDYLYGNDEFEVLNTSTTQFETNVEKVWNNFDIDGKTEQASTPTPSEPINLISVGYQNLFNLEYAVEKQYNASGNEISARYVLTNNIITIDYDLNYYGRTFFNKLTLPEGTYTLQYIASLSGSNKSIRASARNYDNLTDIFVETFYITDGTLYSHTFTLTTQTTIGISIVPSNTTGGTLSLQNIQLETGTKANTFIPYGKYCIEIKNTGQTESNTQRYILDEPLRAIGNYKDRLYIDYGYLYVERKIGKVILDGSESWSFATNGNAWYISGWATPNNAKLPPTNNDTSNSLSNYFPNVARNQLVNVSNGFGITTSGALNIKHQDYTSSSPSITTWLSTHNVEVNYILQTPTTEVIGTTKATLPTAYEGTNDIEINAGIDTTHTIYYYWKNYDVLFAGVVKNSGDISLNPRHPHYCSLQILDYKTFLSESNTLDFVIANKTIQEAIEMVVNAVSNYGFVVGTINIDSANDIIGAYSTLNKTAYDVLQYLAEISGSRWRARYVDSSTMAIDFYDPETLPQADDLEYTTQYWEDNNIVDITFNYGTRDYRNKQVLLSNEVYANINYEETLISNGYGDTFTLQNNVGILLNVIVDNQEKTIGTTNDKQMGIDADFYYTPGKNIIESNGVYSAGAMIRITYQPLVKGRQIVYNASEVERINEQTQTEGVIARYESRNDILSSEELQKIAQTYIEYKGKAEVVLTITTQNKDLYNIGEVVYFNAPIDDLKQNYMVKTKKTEYIVINDINNLFYVYELTSSFNSEKAINYFDNQRNKASGNIAEGESITRNIDIETQVGIIWTDGEVSSATITVDGDNVLNSILNSPFIE